MNSTKDSGNSFFPAVAIPPWLDPARRVKTIQGIMERDGHVATEEELKKLKLIAELQARAFVEGAGKDS